MLVPFRQIKTAHCQLCCRAACPPLVVYISYSIRRRSQAILGGSDCVAVPAGRESLAVIPGGEPATVAVPASGGGVARIYDGQRRQIVHAAAGNVIVLEESDGSKTWRFTYDYRNRLVKAEEIDYTLEAPAWENVATYLYDGLNRRVEKNLESGTDILYLYDGWRCIEKRNATSPGTVLRQYVYGGQYIDEVVCKIEDPDAAAVKQYYMHDANFNVVALAEDDGDVIERCWYKPYGTTTFTDAAGANPVTSSAKNNTFAFQGRRLDSETGLYYFRNRYYSSEMGRFVQRDPAGYQDGWNLYEFVRAGPTSGRDPSGLCVVFMPPGNHDTCRKGVTYTATLQVYEHKNCGTTTVTVKETTTKSWTLTWSFTASGEGSAYGVGFGLSTTVSGSCALTESTEIDVPVKGCTKMRFYRDVSCVCSKHWKWVPFEGILSYYTIRPEDCSLTSTTNAEFPLSRGDCPKGSACPEGWAQELKPE